MTVDDATGVGPCANTEENHAATVATLGLEVPSPEEEYRRWSPCEWGELEFAGAERFDRACQLLDGLYRQTQWEYDLGGLSAPQRWARALLARLRPGLDFAQYRAGVLEAMQNALATLDAEGFFGEGEAREAVTIFLSLNDSEETEDLEERSARALNSPAVYERFSLRYRETQRRADEEEQHRRELQASIADRSPEQQAECWLARLSDLVDRPPDDPGELFAVKTRLLDLLVRIGPSAVLPILDFVLKRLADDDRQVDALRFDLLDKVGGLGHGSPEIHSRLAQLLRDSCAYNQGRELWHTTPLHLASCLHALFEGYPWPMLEQGNVLGDYEEFLARCDELAP